MSRNTLETVMGAVVLVVAAIFLVFAYRGAEIHAVSGYQLTASFDHVDGIREGSDVRLSGVKVGSVTGEKLDPKSFRVTLAMSIDDAVRLPSDTVPTVTSSGLLGDKFISLVPGNADETLKPGGSFAYGQSAPSLESLLGQVVFSLSNNKGGNGGSGNSGSGNSGSGGNAGATDNAGPAANAGVGGSAGAGAGGGGNGAANSSSAPQNLVPKLDDVQPKHP